MAEYKFSENQGGGYFHIGRPDGVLVNGAEFTLTSVVTGTWSDTNGTLVNKAGCNSIRFKTSLSDKLDDAVNINLFIGRKRVVYDAHGEMKLLYAFEEHEELRKFLENNIGRDEADTTRLKGTAKEVGEKVLADFFKGRKMRVEALSDVFFKEEENGKTRFVPPYSPVTVIKFV